MQKFSLVITRYEDYKNDPIKFRILCQSQIYNRKLSDSENREIKRYRATDEIIRFIEKYKTNNNNR